MKYGRSVVAAGILTVAAAGVALAWGVDGHRMISRVAADGLPADMPAFFTDAAPQLEWLGPEPDRWRDGELSAMDEGWKYDHYIDLENVPDDALDAPDRYAFLVRLSAAGVEDPAGDVGFLPYRILEMYQRLTSGFARWRNADDDGERAWIQQRIINDAGILGHFVADAANPHHTTIHYNGWDPDAPNPQGYTTERDFHWRFESQFAGAVIDRADLEAAVPEGAEVVTNVRRAVWSYLTATHNQVDHLYRIEKHHGFDPENPAPQAKAFTLRRLAAGATMLRTLWYSAWVESAAVAARED